MVKIFHFLIQKKNTISIFSLAVEVYIAKGRDGISEGVSGEGSLLDNAKGFYVAPVRGASSQETRITLAAARYASEEAAALVHYAIALIEYTKLCQPLRLAKHKVDKLKQELLEAEQKQLEKENEVC
jgi:dynein heavy chain